MCFNFRADRVREILSAPCSIRNFPAFHASAVVRFAAPVGMAQYSEALDTMMQTVFPPQSFANILGEVVAGAGRTQLRMAESEKYPHVTYFLNGGHEDPYRGEDRILVPSPKVATYDLQPEMSAPELTDKAVAAIASGKYDLIVLNYANPDMVGHTGSLAAAIKAVETVDTGPWPHCRCNPEIRRRAPCYRRPRQLRDDARPANKRPAHIAYDEPRAADAAWCAQPHAGRARTARRYRADLA